MVDKAIFIVRKTYDLVIFGLLGDHISQLWFTDLTRVDDWGEGGWLLRLLGKYLAVRSKERDHLMVFSLSRGDLQEVIDAVLDLGLLSLFIRRWHGDKHEHVRCLWLLEFVGALPHW